MQYLKMENFNLYGKCKPSHAWFEILEGDDVTLGRVCDQFKRSIP